MQRVIGLDLGTTNVKAVNVNAAGDVIASSSREVRTDSPQAGYAEQDAAAVWAAVQAVLDATGDADAICISGAMHTLMPVDAHNNPLAPAMTWADRRCADDWRALGGAEREHYARTGCPSHVSYHPARLRWWRRATPDAAMFIGIKDWIIGQLTGRCVTDVSSASSTGLLDIHTGQWHEPMLQLAGAAAEQLSPIVACDQTIGEYRGTAVIAGASDGALANLTAGDGTVITIGTSGAARRVVDAPQFDDRERTWCYIHPRGRFLAGGAINSAGLLLKWLRQIAYRDMPPNDAYALMLEEALTVEPGAAGVTVLPYLAGERCPHYLAESCATFHGMTLHHTRVHLARAAIEAIAFCMRDVITALQVAGSSKLTGGITRYPPWAQILSDVLGMTLEPIDIADASALGAAMLGHGIDLHVPPGEAIEPDARAHRQYDAPYARFHALFDQLTPQPPHGDK